MGLAVIPMLVPVEPPAQMELALVPPVWEGSAIISAQTSPRARIVEDVGFHARRGSSVPMVLVSVRAA